MTADAPLHCCRSRRCTTFEAAQQSLKARDGLCDAAIGAITNSIEREQQGIRVRVCVGGANREQM